MKDVGPAHGGVYIGSFSKQCVYHERRSDAGQVAFEARQEHSLRAQPCMIVYDKVCPASLNILGSGSYQLYDILTLPGACLRETDARFTALSFLRRVDC